MLSLPKDTDIIHCWLCRAWHERSDRRCPWLKIIIWTTGTLLVLSTAFYVYSLIPERPKVEKSFWDVPLGASKTDVLFLKGNPTTKQGDDWVYVLNDAGRNWGHSYHVSFTGGKVWCVAHLSATDLDWREQIQGISIGSTENYIREKFGAPSRVVPSDDGLQRIYHYEKYNLVFQLTRNKVIGLGIYNPVIAPKGVMFRPE